MPDFRAFSPLLDAGTSRITLSPEESHHLVTVNRAKVGDLVVVFDGKGADWTCELVEARKAGAALQVRTRRSFPLRAGCITLAQALPKGSAMDGIVRKATEIGAAKIVPLETERTQVHLDGDRSDKKVEKWRTAALEAAKQCGNPFLPEIAPVQSLATFLATLPASDLRLVASLHPGARSLKLSLQSFRAQHGRAPQEIVWLIGPEGDLTATEIEVATTAGFVPVTLGPLVLRCETAATYALSILSYELQD